MNGLISDIQRFSIHDGPGIRTTVFLKGCPLECLWCANPETISRKPEIMFSETSCLKCGICPDTCRHDAISFTPDEFPSRRRDLCIGCGACVQGCPSNALGLRGTLMSAQAVLGELEKDMPFYRNSGGGVTLSGGEPFYQADFIEAVIALCAERGIHTAVDTSGYAPWFNIERSIDAIDLFLYDLKHIDPMAHQRGTMVSNSLILENLEKILKRGKRVILRLPLIPEFNSSETDLEAIARFAARAGVKEVRILPYHNYGRGKYKRIGKAYSLENMPVMETEDAQHAKKIIKKYIPNVAIGG